ncbi:MAG TPA: efflux RND transporter permease subunit, partial [Phycisphaeraceae bacterium]
MSEVASIGGFVKQYQVTVDPVKLRAYGITLDEVNRAVARSNQDAGGRVLELGEAEYMVRGRGYLGTAEPDAAAGDDEARHSARVVEHLRHIALGATDQGVPIELGDVASVHVGPQMRRGVLEWNGQGQTAGGIVVMRFGQNARDTIERVKARLAELEAGLPPGVAIVTGYDRSDLIQRSVETLTHTLAKEMAVVAVVVLVFLLHARSALVALIVLPTGVLTSLLAMHLLSISANIMSLGGIALAIGVMVDSSIVLVENAHVRLKQAGPVEGERRLEVIRQAAKEVGPSLFFSLLVITVSFLPVFVLGEQSGRLFKPLAYTKTFAMAAAAVLAVTITPALMVYFVRDRLIGRELPRGWRLAAYLLGMLAPAAALMFMPLGNLEPWRTWLAIGATILAALMLLPQPILSDERNPLSRVLEAAYHPFFVAAMKFWPLTLAAAVSLVLTMLYPLSRLGSEFMPPLEEGDLLYMPTTREPGISITKAGELLQQTDKLIRQFPEVQAVWGKAGQAETATDPAPLNMIETTITLHRDKERWRKRRVERFYSDWPDWLAWLPRKILPDVRPITVEELIYGYEGPGGQHVPGLNDALQIPGLANSWTMPIRTRIDMLSTGFKTPVGIKVMGPDLATLSDLSEQMAQALLADPRTSRYTASAYSDRDLGGRYVVAHPDREQIARYGLHVQDVLDAVAMAVGGQDVTLTVEGLARYPVNVRYPRELREDLAGLRQVLVATPSGAQVPLGQLAKLSIQSGPSMIKSEAARPSSWVYVDVKDIDVGTYVDLARQVVSERVEAPGGYSVVWSGQYEQMQALRARMAVAIPLTLAAIAMLLYMATRSWLRVLLIFASLSLSLVGAVWLIHLLGYH